jgi:quinoprotein glucose dehydrogenase
MKHLFVLIAVLALAGTLKSLQAGSAPQTAPAAPAGKTAEQQKTDESQCIKWAKQQAGLSQPDAQQPAATSGSEKAGAAPANQGAAPANQGAAPANQGAAPANQAAAPAKPADNAGQSSTASGITSSAINEAESKLGLGGAANSKITELAKDAYAQCMEKKGYKAK